MTVAMLQHQFKLETTKTSTKITEDVFSRTLGTKTTTGIKKIATVPCSFQEQLQWGLKRSKNTAQKESKLDKRNI